MNPPTGLTITAFYSLGDWNGYCHIKWTSPAQPADAYYRIEYHDAVSLNWVWQSDVPPNQGAYGIDVRFAMAPAGGTPKSIIVDQVRITAKDVEGVSADAAATILTPTSLTATHFAASNFAVVCSGGIGEPGGIVDFTWDDLTMFVRNGRVTLTKYGVTSPGIKRTLYDSTFTAFSSEYGPNRTHIPILLFPPGLKLDANLTWDPFDPPSNDPEAPFWVVENDLLTLTVITTADGDTAQKIAEFTFEYHREVTLRPVNEAIVELMTQSFTLELIQDPNLPIPMTASVAYISGLPAGYTFNPSTLVISGSTSTPGTYEPIFDITSEGNKTIRQSISLTVVILVDRTTNEWPVITAPPPAVALIRALDYPPEFNLYAPGSGSFQIVSGTLPQGLSLDLATGKFSGTPLQVEAPHAVVFRRRSVINWGPDYTVTFSVVQGPTPVITSEGTATAKLDEVMAYRIVTDIPADDYQAFELPDGLILTDGVIVGIADTFAGPHTVYLQAKNLWGWGAMFVLVITVDIDVPTISSPSTVDAIINQPFFYQIVATNEPIFFGADGLPDGLEINAYTGVISGIPTGLSQGAVTISAINKAGIGTSDLAINVALPAVPVIDTSALTGRALTLQPGEAFIFQPSASNNPTRWTADPLTQGLNFDTISGRLSGQFLTDGFYSIIFVAYNAGGASAPATFYFAVGVETGGEGQPPPPPPPTQIPIDVVDLWIDLDSSIVSIDGPTSSQANMTVKRGDSTVITIIFHRAGVPTDLTIAALYFGAKVAFDDDYIVYSTAFTRVDIGKYRTYPDFSDQNNDLDSILSTDKVDLLGEIQWDTTDDVRRSTQTFGVTVLRDLLHPDPTLS